MAFFELASAEEVVRIETEDGKDFIEVKAELSKAEFNKLAMNGPRNAEDTAGGLNFIDQVVQTLVVDWSFKDADGNPVPFDMKLYRSLKAPAANWISTKVMEHFNTITKVEVEEAEGKQEN